MVIGENWVRVDRSYPTEFQSRTTTFYVDKDSIQKSEGFIFFWDMSDYDKPFRGDLSVKGFNKGDCEKKRVQLLLVSAHQEQMAKGEGVIFTDPKPEWDSLATNSPGIRILNFACANR